MEIAASQLLNPGVFEYDDKRRKELADFKKAVQQARFLSFDQKRRWQTLGYMLNNEQLEEAQEIVMAENLQHLKTKQKLEKIKPNKDQ